MSLRVLSISTLFPNPVKPAFGKFVANQMGGIAKAGGVDLVMVNPIGLPPFPLNRREPYRTLGACPDTSQLGTLAVHHPRFTLVPVVGGDSNPGRMARAVLPLARRLHAQQPFDLVDAQFFFPDGPAAAIIARELGLPLTIKARGSDIHYWGTRPKALKQMRKAASQAARILTVSAALGRDMAALGFPDDRILVHYTGLDRHKFRVTPRADARRQLAPLLGLDIPASAPLIVTPGALIAIKGQKFAIGALTHLPGAHLALAGSGGDEAELREMANQVGLASRVHFLGQISHDSLPVLMSAADAVVLPSEREGLANVWIEALACGAPLVIPDIGGAAEVVRNPSAGRLAERSAAAIAAALQEIWITPPDQTAVAANVATFSWDANAAQLLAIWQEAAQQR